VSDDFTPVTVRDEPTETDGERHYEVRFTHPIKVGRRTEKATVVRHFTCAPEDLERLANEAVEEYKAALEAEGA